MPTKNNEVIFKFGTSEEYNFTNKDPSTIYFITDTHEIYIGTEKYGGSDVAITDLYQHLLLFTGDYESHNYTLMIQIINDQSTNFQQNIPAMMNWLSDKDGAVFMCTGWIWSTSTNQNMCPAYVQYDKTNAAFNIFASTSAGYPAITTSLGAIAVNTDIVTKLI